MMQITIRQVRRQGLVMICTMILCLAATGKTRAGEAFTGEVVQTPPQTLAAGEVELVIHLEVPGGYELISDAPAMATITSMDQGVVALGAESGVTCRQPEFPLRLPLEANPGDTRLQADLVLYYCQKEGAALCITKQARLILPVRVDKASQNKELRASYKLPALKTGD
jgi:hypothetical protein